MLSEFDKKNIGAIITQNMGDWFSAMLIRVIAKADLGNRRLLAKGFPDHVKAVNEWQGVKMD